MVVRDGQLPAGADETVAEAGGAVLVAGSETGAAAGQLAAASRVWLAERSSVAGPAALASALAEALPGVDMVLLPESPDGRDLAPRLAVALGRPLLAGAVRCAPEEVEVTRLDDRLSVRVGVDGPVVVTLRPGSRGKPPTGGPSESRLSDPARGQHRPGRTVPRPDPGPRRRGASRCCNQSQRTADLAEARRIVGGGAGLVPAGADGAAVMRLLADVGAALEASAGATRVVTDAGWMSFDRQIGITGVSVSPRAVHRVRHLRRRPARRRARRAGARGEREYRPVLPDDRDGRSRCRRRRPGGAQGAGRTARRDRGPGGPSDGGGPCRMTR